MRSLVLLLLVVACASGCETPEIVPIAFDFQGYKIGDPVTDEIMEKTTGDMTDGDAFLYFEVKMPGYGNKLNCTLDVIDSRIERINLNYPETLQEDLLAAFSDKFGPPHDSYSSGSYLWHTTDGDFYFGETGAWIHSAKSLAAIDKYEADKQQALRDSLDGQ